MKKIALLCLILSFAFSGVYAQKYKSPRSRQQQRIQQSRKRPQQQPRRHHHQRKKSRKTKQSPSRELNRNQRLRNLENFWFWRRMERELRYPSGVLTVDLMKTDQDPITVLPAQPFALNSERIQATLQRQIQKKQQELQML